jgi:hypothetical protein
MSLLSHEPASREYVLGRLDREHIAELADQAQSCLRELGRAVELCYMPGDATWYSITIAPVWHVVGAPGGGHRSNDGAYDDVEQSYYGVRDRKVFMIAYAQKNEVVFCSDDEDWEWIAQKFDSTPASQLAIAELLKAVFTP